MRGGHRMRRLNKNEKVWLQEMLKAHIHHIWGNEKDVKMCEKILLKLDKKRDAEVLKGETNG